MDPLQHILVVKTASLDVIIEKYTESPGLYYDDSGTAQPYNTEWKVDRQIEEVENMKLLVKQLTRIDEEAIQLRFNSIGGMSKILFLTMDSEDASYYTDKISELEREQAIFFKLSEEQRAVVTSTLRSMNTTLQGVYAKERTLPKGLENMARHATTEHDGEIKGMFTSTSMLLAVNEHSAQVHRALGECKRDYEFLIEAIIKAQKGILQPHVNT
ncbi:hypothetical protein B7P43_G16722 [Cryptotermes secundus]|uniref:Uncharacterized protein n=1 Tax=Cryptotermes secundus TaxID=105785 RepID=A0A2J7RIY3_9NEOP|nr:hypothetical protein B7P43_G16722 [Cryptotermes secundus]